MATNKEVRNFQTLSARRKEVLQHICKGRNYYQISELLYISKGAVRTTLFHVYRHLELLELPSEERVEILREIYCPLFDLDLPIVEEEDTAELEPVKALVVLEPEDEKLLDEDQKSLVKIFGAELEAPKSKSKGGYGRFVIRFVLLAIFVAVIAAVAVFGWENLPEIVEDFSGQPDATKISELVASQLADAVAVSNTPVLSATNTAAIPPIQLPTSIESPSSTPTQRPSPTADFGPIYEVGEWHEEDDIWFRLFDYEIDGDIVRFLIEVWNKSNQDILFQWSSKQNISLKDNLGNDYELGAKYEFDDYDETILAQEKVLIQHGISYTVGFYAEQLYLPSVTEAFITLEYFSRIERATWIIYIAK